MCSHQNQQPFISKVAALQIVAREEAEIERVLEAQGSAAVIHHPPAQGGLEVSAAQGSYIIHEGWTDLVGVVSPNQDQPGGRDDRPQMPSAIDYNFMETSGAQGQQCASNCAEGTEADQKVLANDGIPGPGSVDVHMSDQMLAAHAQRSASLEVEVLCGIFPSPMLPENERQGFQAREASVSLPLESPSSAPAKLKMEVPAEATASAELDPLRPDQMSPDQFERLDAGNTARSDLDLQPVRGSVPEATGGKKEQGPHVLALRTKPLREPAAASAASASAGVAAMAAVGTQPSTMETGSCAAKADARLGPPVAGDGL